MIVWDPLNWYVRDGYGPEFDIVVSKPSELLAFVREHLNGDFRILYAPKHGNMMQHWRAVGSIAKAAGDLLLVIDEIGMLCQGGRFKPDAKGRDPILEELVHFGRHRELTIIATAQLPPDVALDYRALCTEMRMFRTIEPTHVEYLAKKAGSATEQLPDLQKYAFVWWKDDGETLLVGPQKGGSLG